MLTVKSNAIHWFIAAIAVALLSGCSAMLIGGGASASPAIGSDSRSSEQIKTDSAVNQSVRRALGSDVSLRSADLSVTVQRGVVTLAGVVGSFKARDRAIEVAANVANVKQVSNQIQVKSY